jgi:Protein of unknown function (DUF2971)
MQNQKQLIGTFQPIGFNRFDTILKDQIHLSKVSSFNDYYEYSLDTTFSNTKEGKDLTINFINAINPETSINAKPYLEKPTLVWDSKDHKSLISYLKDSYKVSCFCDMGFIEVGKPKEAILTLDFNKILLDHKHWAHYGNMHYGFCTVYGFDSQKIENINSFCKVNYSDSIPKLNKDDFIIEKDGKINTNKTLSKLATKIITTKSKSWESENEIRFIKKTEFDKVKISEIGLKLVNIIFGLKVDTESEMIKLFIDNIRSRNPNVSIYKLEQIQNMTLCKAILIS